MEPTTWENLPHPDYTADGVEITPGLEVYNYNGDKDIVIKPSMYGNPSEPQWYKTEKGVFDGSRLSVRRPW